jgi:hypothetical protein
MDRRSSLSTPRRRVRLPGEPRSAAWGLLIMALLFLMSSAVVFFTLPSRPLARLERALSVDAGVGSAGSPAAPHSAP